MLNGMPEARLGDRGPETEVGGILRAPGSEIARPVHQSSRSRVNTLIAGSAQAGLGVDETARRLQPNPALTPFLKWPGGKSQELASIAADDPLRSATILTTVPNTLLSAVHNRMPVILSELAWDRWLDPTLTDPTSLLPLLRPAPDDLLEAIPVGPLVNSARNQGPELLEAVGPPLGV